MQENTQKTLSEEDLAHEAKLRTVLDIISLGGRKAQRAMANPRFAESVIRLALQGYKPAVETLSHEHVARMIRNRPALRALLEGRTA